MYACGLPPDRRLVSCKYISSMNECIESATVQHRGCRWLVLQQTLQERASACQSAQVS